MKSEKVVKAKIKQWLRETFKGAFTWMPVSNGMGTHGIPDHIACVPVKITPDMVGQTIGIFVAIEAKTESGKLSDHQKRRLEEISHAGGVVEVVYGDGESLDRMCESLKAQLL